MADVLLGVDMGTSSSKGVLASPTARSWPRSSGRTTPTSLSPGFVEHDPEGVWWGDFKQIVSELLDKADGHEVKGVSVSGIGACTLPADADGNPLRSAILYGIDTRAGREIDELNERYGEDEILERAPRDPVPPVDRPEAGLDPAQPAGDLGEDQAAADAELVHRRAAHRRVHARLGLGRVLHPAVRRQAGRVDPGVGRGGRPGTRRSRRSWTPGTWPGRSRPRAPS